MTSSGIGASVKRKEDDRVAQGSQEGQEITEAGEEDC